MTRRLSAFFLLALGALVSPLAAHAANIPLLSPGWAIVPTECQSCACGFKEVLQLVQNLMNAGVSLSIVIMVLAITFAGVLFLSSPTSPENRTKGKTAVSNAVVGMIIVLAAWVAVDFFMKLFYGGTFGPWNNILGTGADACVQAVATQPLFNGNILVTPGSPGTYGTGSGGTTGGGSGTGSCDPNAVQQAATTGGYNIDTTEAKILACLAKPESSCGANTSGAHSSGGVPSSAAGPWQILLGAKDACHSLNIPACGNLNCSAAYSGGKPKSDPASQALAAQCQAEANNLTCAASAAACIVQASHGSYSAWTGTGDGYSHSAQSQCVQSGGG